MRKIEFRGKSKKTGKWVYGYYFKDFNGKSYIINTLQAIETADASNVWVEVLEETIGQYTGLKDKNGKEIYEGDTVKINAHNYDYGFKQEEIGQIKFIDGSFGFYRKIDNIKYCFYDLPTEVAEREIDYYEVIGNIWDNLELLKEEK